MNICKLLHCLFIHTSDLPFESVLSCGATCHSMVQAIPLVTKLCIDKSTQMNVAVGKRFVDVNEIHINSLLQVTVDQEDGFTDMNIDMETRIRLVPFLSTFAKLDRVVFRGKNSETGNVMDEFAAVDAYFYEGDMGYPNEGARESMLAFLDLVSGGFNCGALPKHLKISGLCCPDATNRQGMRSDNCETCLRACRSFPLKSVVDFECRGSSSNDGRSGRMHGLDVCLERAQIESIIESRPGGSEYLRSDKRLLRLLGRGRRYSIPSDEGNVLHFVKYTQEQLEEIKRVIEYAELDVRTLETQTVSSAIMKSFAVEGTDSVHPKRYISEASLEYLKDKLSLPVDKEAFDRSVEDLLEHAEQFVWVLNQGEAEINEDATEVDLDRHHDIEVDCLKLICRFLEIENNPPIHQVAGAISFLAIRLSRAISSNEGEQEIACAIKNILAKGTEEHVKMVIDAGVITSFSQLLDSTKIASVATHALAEIATRGTNYVYEEINDAGAIPKLIKLLDSNQNDCINHSLQVLVAVKDHTRGWQSSLLTRLVSIMKAPESELGCVVDCSILLRKIFEADKPPIETSIDLGLPSTIVEITKTTKDEGIKTNLSHVIVCLFAGTKKQTTEVVVKEEGLLSVLVGLLESQDDSIVEKATSKVGKIADMSDEHRDMLIQLEIMPPLMRLLKQTTNVRILQDATWVFATCCRGWKIDFAVKKETLKMLTGLLMKEDTNVVGHACWAIYNLLDTLKCEQVSNVIKMRLVNMLLQHLSESPLFVQQPILKILHLISSAGDASKAITHSNGVVCLSKALCNSSLEENQKLACCSLSNIISGNEDLIQTSIDNNVVSCLTLMLTIEHTKKDALWAIYQMTKCGSAAQIQLLVKSEDCASHLCDLLIDDCSTAIIALWALKHVSLNIQWFLILCLLYVSSFYC